MNDGFKNLLAILSIIGLDKWINRSRPVKLYGGIVMDEKRKKRKPKNTIKLYQGITKR